MIQVEATAGRDVVPTLVLCCAKDTRHLLPPALELLVARGFQVEVVSGLELRDDAVLVTAQRKKDAAYVLFESGELGPELLERTKAKLVAAGVKPQRIACMPLDWRGPLDVVARAEHLVVSPPAVRRPTAVNLGTAAAAIPPPVPQVSRPKETPAVGLPTVPHQPLVSASVPVLEGGGDADTYGFVHARRRLLLGTGALTGALALILGISAIASDDEEQTASSETVAIASPGPSPFSAAWSWLRRSHGAQAEVIEAPAPAVVAVAAPLPVVPPPAVAIPVPAVPSAAPTPAAPAAAPAVVPPDPKPATPEAAPHEEVVEVEDVAEIDEAEMQAIYAGLIAQKFRALDILLIAPEPRKRIKKRLTKNPAKMTWGQAAAYCDKLAVAGVADWRLPRVGELGSITGGSLIADGKFWSQTEGDTFGKSRVVWNTQTSKMGSAPVRWKGGRVVCVRTMARPPEPPAP